MRHTVIALIILVAGLSAEAIELADTVRLNFRLARTEVDTTYADNGRALSRVTDRQGRLRSVRVVGGASPEGSEELNRRLSRGRAHGIFDYVGRHINP